MKIRIEIEWDVSLFDEAYRLREMRRITRSIEGETLLSTCLKDLDGREIRDIAGNVIGQISVEE